jgi:hypothetical protein
MALRSRPSGGGFKPPHAALAEDRRGERCGKGARWGCQVGTRKMSEPEPLWTCRYKRGDIETVARFRAAGAGPGGCPMTGQVVSGMEAA